MGVQKNDHLAAFWGLLVLLHIKGSNVFVEDNDSRKKEFPEMEAARSIPPFHCCSAVWCLPAALRFMFQQGHRRHVYELLK